MPVFSKFALASVAAADFYALAPGLQSTAPAAASSGAYSLPTPAYAAPAWVERFDRRGTEPFDPFEPFEFFQNRNFP